MHILYTFLVFLSCTCLASNTKPQSEPADVGFSLSSNYGTVSARFSNETLLDIAKIDGDAAYKDYMLSARNASYQLNTMNPSKLSLWKTSDYHLPSHLCQSLSGSNKPLSSMMLALRSAAETALDQKVKNVSVGLPHLPEFQTQLREDVWSALRDADLRSWGSTRSSNPMLTRYAYDLERTCTCTPSSRPEECHDDPEKVVLVLENTRETLSAVLYLDECGFWEGVRYFTFYEHGPESSNGCIGRGYGSSCTAELQARLRSLLDWSTPDLLPSHDSIDEVIIIGEASNDELLLSTLKGVLKEQFGSDDYGQPVNRDQVDPTFAAANGAAIMSSIWREEYLEVSEDVLYGFLADSA